ncbi:MAG: bifunctional riboflavin kinase/FAD synthetase [Nitrospirae bacterium]|nr:bifunctional riboflavin kinase/FAD synthetase [Nitrospirota bacterium]
MKIYREIKNLKDELKRPILTIGNFDGVHLGHQAILKKIVSRAKEAGGHSVVFTFEPHPLKVIAPDKDIRLITSCDERVRLIEDAGVGAVICANFTKEFAEQNPDDFVKNVLHKKIGVFEVYVGHDYAFGKDREGTISHLKELGKRYGFYVGVIEPVVIDGAIVSSSRIRQMILDGNVDNAAKLLGRNYALNGMVVEGAGRGRKLGFPTANIELPSELIPKDGVYAVKVKKGDKIYDGVANIGNKPTFKNERFGVEAYLFGFNGSLYNEMLEIEFVKRIRNEMAFRNADELIAHMKDDVSAAKEILKLKG